MSGEAIELFLKQQKIRQRKLALEKVSLSLHRQKYFEAIRPHAPHLPQEAFIENTLPVTDRKGRTVHVRALAVRREFAEQYWREKEELLTVKDREDFQVVVIPSEHRVNNKANAKKDPDFTAPFIKKARKEKIGRYPVAIYKDQNFSDDLEARKWLGGEKIPETVYLVASPINEKDISKIRTAAYHLKYDLHVKKVVLVTSHMPFGREDKSGVMENDVVQYTGQMITLAAELKGLQDMVDFMYVGEPHSSFTQAAAAKAGIPLAPLSLWKVGVNEIRKREDFDEKNIVVLGPDIGRNKAANAAGEELGAPVVGLNKHRDPETRTIWFDPLNEDQKRAVMGESGKGGKDVLMYDDEGASLSTSADIVEGVITSYNPRSINIVLAHRRFTADFVDEKGDFHPGWKANLHRMLSVAKSHNVKLNIYVTDSREPIGDIQSYEKGYGEFLKVIPLTQFIIDVIRKDVAKVNFWQDPEEKNIIL